MEIGKDILDIFQSINLCLYLATARLRREYTESRDDNYEDDKRMIRERTKFAEQMKLVNALLKEQKACVIPVRRKPHVDSAFRKIWQQQIHKM